MNPIIQFGLETEIGIFRDTTEELDVVAESIALVRSATEPGVYRVEAWKSYLGIKRGWVFSNPIYVR